MNDDRLRQLLLDADAASAAPTAVPGLAERARRRRRRRTQVRAASAAAIALIFAVAGILHLAARPPAKSVIVESAFDAAAAARQIAALEAQAAAHAELAERLEQAELQARRLARAQRALAALSPLVLIEREADRAAMLAIAEADRLLNELNRRDAAAAEYRRTIELFPQSHWAVVARDRLRQIQTGKEG